MANGEGAVKIVDPKEAAVDADPPLVHVDSIEKGSFFSFLKGSNSQDADGSKKDSPPVKKEEASPPKPKVVHEAENIKTTYDVEEDVPPSLLEQLKRKFHWNGR